MKRGGLGDGQSNQKPWLGEQSPSWGGIKGAAMKPPIDKQVVVVWALAILVTCLWWVLVPVLWVIAFGGWPFQ